jgi:threonine-phosphate decarboxylase
MYGLKPTLQAHASCAGWICNPNNPTGAFTDIDYLPPFGAVVLDQSYEDFTTTQLLSPREAIKKGNVWQIHSLTKVYAVPGLRIGYIVSAPENIQALRRHIRPWSVNALAILAGKWLIEHEDAKAVRDIRDMLAETQRFQENLNKIPSIQAFRTCTHFFLARIHGHKAAELKDYLAREHHLLIRDASNFNGLDAHFFRISTQLPKENDLLLQAIQQFVEKDY